MAHTNDLYLYLKKIVHYPLRHLFPYAQRNLHLFVSVLLAGFLALRDIVIEIAIELSLSLFGSILSTYNCTYFTLSTKTKSKNKAPQLSTQPIELSCLVVAFLSFSTIRFCYCCCCSLLSITIWLSLRVYIYECVCVLTVCLFAF